VAAERVVEASLDALAAGQVTVIPGLRDRLNVAVVYLGWPADNRVETPVRPAIEVLHVQS